MLSKSEPIAPKKAPNVVSGPGPWSTKISLPTGAGVTVQPVKSPVSKSPLIMRFSAEVEPAVAKSKSPKARKQLPIDVFIDASSYQNGKIGQALKNDIFVNFHEHEQRGRVSLG